MNRPKNHTTWQHYDGVFAVVLAVKDHHDEEHPERDATFVQLAYLNAPADFKGSELMELKAFNERMTQVGLVSEKSKRPRHPWEVYLADRADGCKGHFAIARWHPNGYQEVWNLRKHTWGAFSDDVLTLEEAEKMLQSISFHPMTPSLRSPV